ncbi:MAG: hypothetical protein CMO21_11145 [Thioclava sp.]|nr:hypothetical protein [Thioclava sp.]|tara:strand:+ start:1802 stop:2800 length:999 start_codon:yes stop_codon:yes gene_type:complete
MYNKLTPIKEMNFHFDLSVVTPLFNEGENISELFKAFLELEDKSSLRIQWIAVDDGSQDDTFANLKHCHDKNPNLVEIVRFSRNFGQHKAIMSGLRASNAPLIAIMDGDLQSLPLDLLRLKKKLESGFDCVSVRFLQKSEFFLKKVFSRIFWLLMSRLSGFEISPNQGTMRLMTWRFVEELKNLNDNIPFFAGMCSWVGFPQTYIIVEQRPRFKGKAKYTFLKNLNLAWDGISSFSIIPLRIAGILGIFFSIAGLLSGIYLIYNRIFHNHGIEGWTSIMVTLLLGNGVQLLILGIIGEYLGRNYQQSLQRPQVIISDHIKTQICQNKQIRSN